MIDTTEPERSLRAVLEGIRERQREIRRVQDAAAEIGAKETEAAKRALYDELETVAETINGLRYAAAYPAGAGDTTL